MVVNRQPQQFRVQKFPYGSAFLAVSQRVAAGSMMTTDPVDVSRHSVKTLGFRGNQHGSWYFDVNFGLGSVGWLTLDQGTFPKSTGSVKTASVSEAYNLVRARIRPTATGSFSVFLGAMMPGLPMT